MGTLVEQDEEARFIAEAIVNTLPDPFVVLDDSLRVVTAGRAFYDTFRVATADTKGRRLFELGDGQWNIPALRTLLEEVIPANTVMDGFEVQHDFPGIGARTMLLNARQVRFNGEYAPTILLAFQDVTARKASEQENAGLLAHAEELLRQKQVLLQELQHRVANSLQIIASILMLKARAVSSEETRHHLEDARNRVLTVAAVQKHLDYTVAVDAVEIDSYLSKLCDSLAASMIGEAQDVKVEVLADKAQVASATAVNIGLIVTELLINAIKYAFPQRKADARILVTYETDGPDWKLTVSDNGVGKRSGDTADGGLGTAIVAALVSQLEARLDAVSSARGVMVSVTRASFSSHMPVAT